MRNMLKGWIVTLSGLLFFSSYAWSQTGQPADQQNFNPGANTLYDKLKNTGPGGPAPRHDISGFWTGALGAKINPVPPMTPWGQEQFRAHKTLQYGAAASNDPFKLCDPLGFPRNMLSSLRGIAIAEMQGKMLVLNQYNRVWRAIWTDGRELPKNVGGRSADSAEPMFYGYSVGNWDGDYSFVVNTVGSDERSWLDGQGHPHSLDMRVQERFTRVDHNTLEDTITIDDPKTYTKPFVISTVSFRWIPEQEFPEEFLCVPSEMSEYMRIMGDPAGK